MDRPFSLIDAFATGPFTGNPAGVVLDAEGLSEAQMQLIAAEIQASETRRRPAGRHASGPDAPPLTLPRPSTARPRRSRSAAAAGGGEFPAEGTADWGDGW